MTASLVAPPLSRHQPLSNKRRQPSDGLNVVVLLEIIINIRGIVLMLDSCVRLGTKHDAKKERLHRRWMSSLVAKTTTQKAAS
jgi:hypothetical protein